MSRVERTSAFISLKHSRVLANFPFRHRAEAEAAHDDPVAPQSEKRFLGLRLGKRSEMPPPAAAPGQNVSQGALVVADGSSANPFSLDDDCIDLDERSACTQAILELFPDISIDFLHKIAVHYSFSFPAAVGYILDKDAAGKPYPRQHDSAALKRKRLSADSLPGNVGAAKQPRREAVSMHLLDLDDADDADDTDEQDDDESATNADGQDDDGTLPRLEAEALRACGDPVRHERNPAARRLACRLFQQVFPYATQKVAAGLLEKHGGCLLKALLDFDTGITDKAPEKLKTQLKKTKTVPAPEYAPDRLADRIEKAEWPARMMLEDYRAALPICELREAKREAALRREQAELDNFTLAQLEGTAQECQCCFGDFAMNRMVHCDGAVFHWFCKDCARRMAETQIGLSKHQLECMSMDGCQAGFARDQQRLFLERKTREALERLETENCLSMAGLENLETCPFCPFAAEYPPLEVNKEFRCLRPDCAAVSCRLCRKPTHIPKTCAEVQRDNAASARLSVEEAMSLAMIRKCNKCGTAFIKEAGCNKMTCTRPGCRNVQCYVCHKSCDYAHFDDANRGGKPGNCPLFDSVDKRHDSEVRSAEEQAVRAATEKNPGIDPAELKIYLSAAVVEDERRRRAF